jgi:bacteriocin-like protein
MITMKNLEVSGFTQLTAEELQNVDGGGLVSTLLGTAEGLVGTALGLATVGLGIATLVVGVAEGVLNPLAATIDGLTSSLPLSIGLLGLGV